MPLAEFQVGIVLIVVVLVALPVGAIVFARGAGGALSEIGKGPLAMEQDFPQSSGTSVHTVSAEVREEEIRQMIQARSDRRVTRGEAPLDVDAEVAALLRPAVVADPELREEVRQLVIARNERRMRRGEEALDVEAEIERQLRDLGV